MSRPACIITRTLPGALASGQRASALGWEPLILPAMQVQPTGADIQVSGVQALLMTSASAARHAMAGADARALPLFAVGDATAEAARLAGFREVISARGDAATLAMLAADRLRPADGALLHLRGGEVAGDVAGMLAACGFQTQQAIVYVTEQRASFLGDVHGALAERAGAVLVHSPAGSRALAAGAAGLDLSRWRLVALSPAALEPCAVLSWRACEAAVRPDEDALMAALSEASQWTSRPD